MFCARCGEETDDAPCRACAGDPLLRGRYRLEEQLGLGAQGTTWRAVDGDRVVAIKELVFRSSTPTKLVELFEREAVVLRQLSHEGIPAYLEHFVVRHGRHRAVYIVQRFVDGPNLAEILEDHRFTAEAVLELMVEALAILAYLHGLSPPVVHRDVKPQNLMRGRDGTLFLVDFGSVRDVVKQLGGSTVAGTFGYMAPEQMVGDATPASDLYGLAATAVHLLTRRAPHELMDRTHRVSLDELGDVEAPVRQLLGDLLQPDPERRPGSAVEVLGRIQGILEHKPGSAAVVRRPRAPIAPLPPVRRGWFETHGRRNLSAAAAARHDRLVRVVEATFEMEGRVGSVGPDLNWIGDDGRRLQVILRAEPAGGRLTAVEDLSPLAVMVYLGAMLAAGISGFGAMILWAWALGAGGVLMGAGVAGATLLVGHAVYLVVRAVHRRALEDELDRIAAAIEG